MLDAAETCALPPYLRRALTFAAQGMTSREAALAQRVKHKTMENYRREARRRLGARSIAQAVFVAALLGLLFVDY